jgi:hypothetical protein
MAKPVGRWSADVTHNSNVLDLERGVFAEYESETDRVFAQAFGRTEHAPKANPFRNTFSSIGPARTCRPIGGASSNVRRVNCAGCSIMESWVPGELASLPWGCSLLLW